MDVQLFWMMVVMESCERKTSESETSSWNQNNGLWNKVSNIEKKHRH